jgi:glutathione synthase
MIMRLLFVMDEIARLNQATDTTLAIIAEARRRGHAADTCVPDSLGLDGPTAYAAIDGGRRPLAEYQAVWMRKDPPFDLEYYFATLLLERARGHTFLVNDPRGLRDANEKLYILDFPSFIPPTRVTRRVAELRRCLEDWDGEMIVKPIDACGGWGVFHVRATDRNTPSILDTSTRLGTRLVVAQRYLPEVRRGDKRILLLDGEVLGAVLRVPRADDTRANLHVGATPERTTLSPRELEICAAVGKRCKADGLHFVGIDVIGGYLTEVNVTSPTGVVEIDRLEGVRLEARIVDWLESRT